jgi:predicted ester cyclase
MVENEQGYNQGNLSVLDDLFSVDFVEHQEGFMPPTLEGVKRNITSLHTAFPDFTMTFEDLIGHEDKTWALMTARGTHQGPFMGIAPSGKAFSISVIDGCRFENSRIAEHWGIADRLSLMMQLGAIPSRPAH